MINRNLLIAFLYLTIVFYPRPSFAQENIFFPDSVISYSLNSLDTTNKIPTSKSIYIYSNDFKLQSKHVFRWDVFSQKWQSVRQFELHHYPTEILVEVYSFDQRMTKVQKGRILIKTDNKQQLLTQVTALIKERNSEKYKPWTQIDFEYRKDTCVSSKYMRSGSTFFLSQESKLEKTNGGFIKKSKFFNEIDKKLIGEESITYLIANKMLKSIQLKSNVNDSLKFVDSLSYQKLKLDNVHHICQTSKVKHNLQGRNYQTKYTYSSDGHLVCQLTYIENNYGQKIQNQLNNLKYFYSNPKSPIRKKNHFNPTIEDQLDLLNDTN